MQKIVPSLWFDDNAEEAVHFYTSLFNDSHIGTVTRYGAEGPGPEGTVMVMTFQLAGQDFMALNGGPIFTFTPALSFFVNCETESAIDELWHRLADGGTILMGLDTYPFSKKFGWVTDKFGVSWQLNLASRAQKIVPFFLFVGQQHGKTEEAMHFYASLFKRSRILTIERYSTGQAEPEGTVMHAVFSLDGQEFMAMESSRNHPFTFTHALSLLVNCETQAEVDELWEKLSAGGTTEDCGWLQDKYGVSWQIVPTVLGELMQDADPERTARVQKAMLQMKKIDIAALQDAARG
ncbi:MAG TPA: VOC family protein [Ktedonobacteraceae bacterium]|nr:VOC family protein [Ktedonobacteraceae bacterium]